MRIFGRELTFKRPEATVEKSLQNVPVQRGWWPIIRESFTGAWQRNEEMRLDTLLNYPALYACVNRIASDIGKLPFSLKSRAASGVWETIDNPAYSPVLRRPNHYQTPQQFREYWAMSKITQGNTYVLKERDNRGVVVGLYVLDPCRVMPLAADNGEVFYQLYTDNLNLLPDGFNELVVPATEIIHDRCICPFHPLIGLPPIAAAYLPALKNMRILKSSAEFFGNNAQPSGILTAPGAISDETAKRLSDHWNTNFTGENAGKVAVVGDDLKFMSLGSKSVDAQMVEQLRYSDEQICQPFGIPPFKVGLGTIPSGLGVDAINQLYLDDALLAHILSMETLLTEGLGATPYKIDLDETVLMRMDATRKAEYHKTLIDGSIETINDARLEFNLGPLAGGDTVYMQMQDMPLDQVRKNTIVQVSTTTEPVVEEPPVAQPVQDDQTQKALAELFLLKAVQAARTEVTR